jgi:hypothetical protein
MPVFSKECKDKTYTVGQEKNKILRFLDKIPRAHDIEQESKRTDCRHTNVLQAMKKEFGWENTPAKKARNTGKRRLLAVCADDDRKTRGGM